MEIKTQARRHGSTGRALAALLIAAMLAAAQANAAPSQSDAERAPPRNDADAYAVSTAGGAVVCAVTPRAVDCVTGGQSVFCTGKSCVVRRADAPTSLPVRHVHEGRDFRVSLPEFPSCRFNGDSVVCLTEEGSGIVDANGLAGFARHDDCRLQTLSGSTAMPGCVPW